MSNRGRQNVASFFTKDMGHQDWRLGAEVRQIAEFAVAVAVASCRFPG